MAKEHSRLSWGPSWGPLWVQVGSKLALSWVQVGSKVAEFESHMTKFESIGTKSTTYKRDRHVSWMRFEI